MNEGKLTTLADLGVASPRNPADILHKKMKVAAQPLPGGRRVVVATWEGLSSGDITHILNQATRNPQTEQLHQLARNIYGDLVLPQRAVADEESRDLLSRHTQSPLIGFAMRQTLEEADPIRAALYEISHPVRENFADTIRIVDMEKFTRWFMRQGLMEHFKIDPAFFVPFLKAQGVAEEEIVPLQNIPSEQLSAGERNRQWKEYRDRRDMLLAQYVTPHSQEELLAFSDNLPLEARLKFLHKYGFMNRLPRFYDPQTNVLYQWGLGGEAAEPHPTGHIPGSTISIQNLEYPETAVYTITDAPNEKGYYPTDIALIAEEKPDVPVPVPTVAWVEETRVDGSVKRRLLSPRVARRCAYEFTDTKSVATNIAGRAIMAALSPDMYGLLPGKMKLNQGENEPANAIGGAQIGTTLLFEPPHTGHSLPRKLAEQPVFQQISNAIK